MGGLGRGRGRGVGGGGVHTPLSACTRCVQCMECTSVLVDVSFDVQDGLGHSAVYGLACALMLTSCLAVVFSEGLRRAIGVHSAVLSHYVLFLYPPPPPPTYLPLPLRPCPSHSSDPCSQCS